MKALIKKDNRVGVEVTTVPQVVSPHDVLIRIALAGICRTDIYAAEGRFPTKNNLILGHEFSGLVEKTGPQVTHVKPGDRVAVMPLFPRREVKLPNGLRSYAASTMMGIEHDGAFCEYVVVPASAVYRLPDTLSLMHGAYMEPIAASMAVLNAAIKPEQKGLIYGDNRISRLTARILEAKGFCDVAICSSEEKLEADSYDFIIETLATTETMNNIVAAVKPGGRIVLKSRQHTPVAFNINTLVMKDITLEAVSYGSFQEAINFLASGALKVDDFFGGVFDLDKFQSTFAASQETEAKKLFFSTANQNVWDR